MKNHYQSTSRQTPNFDWLNFPKELRPDVMFAMETLIRDLATIEQINACIEKKYRRKLSLTLAQMMIADRILNLKDVVEIQQRLKSWNQDQLQSRYQKGPKVDFVTRNHIPVLVKKAGFKKIDRYEIIREIGRGGMGVVYAAQDPKLGRVVALKTLLISDGDSNDLERFHREAQLAASLKHAHIVSVHEVGEYENIHYFTMDYVDGLPLSEYVKAVKLELQQLIAIVRDVADALAYAHSKGIIHRDIKPANILVDADGGVHLTDFGLARRIRSNKRLTVSGAVIGTPSYMSPEQAQGKKIGKAGDIYSLGSVFYELLVGRPPFAGATMAQTLVAVIEQPPVSPRSLVKGMPRDVENICLKCLEKEPERRYPSAKSLTADLTCYLQGKPVKARRAGNLYRGKKWIQRNKSLSILLLGSIAVVCIFVYLFWLAPGAVTVITQTKFSQKIVPSTIEIDGRKIRQRFLSRYSLSSGFHHIRMSLPHHYPLQFTVNIESRKELKLEKAFIHEQGAINITSPLAELEIVLKNQQTGNSHKIAAPVYQYAIDTGLYTVIIKKRNYFSQRMQVDIIKGQTQSLHVKLEPMLLWKQGHHGMEDVTNIAAVDLDRDGNLELIKVSKTGVIHNYDLNTLEQRWKYQGDHQLSYSLREIRVAFHDVNRDGALDMIIGHYGRFMVIDSQKRQEIFAVPNWWGSVYAVKDTNGDGYEDYILFKRYHGIHCYDGKNSELRWQKLGKLGENSKLATFIDNYRLVQAIEKKILCFDIRDGRIVWSFPLIKGGIPQNMVRVIGKKQRPTLIWFSPGRGVVCLNLQTRKILWEYPLTKSISSAVRKHDVNGDGTPEILVHIDQLYCFNSHTGALRWQFSCNSKLGGFPPVIADLEGDGIPEVVVATKTGETYIVNGKNGRLINEFRAGLVIRSPFLVDTDGDHTLEILLLTRKELYCLRHRPSDAVRFHEDLALTPATPTLIDYDEDGHQELLVGNNAGQLYCLEGRTWQQQWSQNFRSGINKPVVLADINNDGNMEIVIRTGQAIMALDKWGEKIWSYKSDWNLGYRTPLAADVDGDGCAEILIATYKGGKIYCLHGQTGKIRWKRNLQTKVYSPLSIMDVDRNGKLDILVQDGLYAYLHCLNAKTGQTRWRSQVRYSNATSAGLAKRKRTHSLDIFMPQTVGHLSCIKGHNGRLRWHRRIPGGTIHMTPLLLKNERNWHLLAATEDGNISCLNADNGALIWNKRLHQNPHMSLTTNMVLCNDVDGDKVKDIISVDLDHSLYIVSGKNGKWLGHFNKFATVKSPLAVQDIDNNGKSDLLFTNSNAQIVCVYNVVDQIKKLQQFPRLTNNFNFDDFLLQLAYWNMLLHNRDYSRLARALTVHGESISKYLRRFYLGICNLAIGQVPTALKLFRDCDKLGGSIFDSRFLQMIACLHLDQRSPAMKLMTSLLSTSVSEFDRCLQEYRHLIKPAINAILQEMLPLAIKNTRCDLQLYKAYQYAVLLKKDRKQRLQLLELSLKYGLTSTPAYADRRQLYVREIMYQVKQNNTLYRMHRSIEIFTKGLQTIPNETIFLTRRGCLYIDTEISLTLGLQDLNRSLQLNAKQAQALFYRGRVYYAQRKNRQALLDINAAVKVQPQLGEAYLYRALVHLALDNKQLARRDLDIVNKKFPKLRVQARQIMQRILKE